MTAEQARRALDARRRRIARIRKAVATMSIVIFVGLFSTIYVQMATGRDPVLGAQSAAKSSGSTSKTTARSTESFDTTDTTSTQSNSGASLTTMTTSQS